MGFSTLIAGPWSAVKVASLAARLPEDGVGFVVFWLWPKMAIGKRKTKNSNRAFKGRETKWRISLGSLKKKIKICSQQRYLLGKEPLYFYRLEYKCIEMNGRNYPRDASNLQLYYIVDIQEEGFA